MRRPSIIAFLWLIILFINTLVITTYSSLPWDTNMAPTWPVAPTQHTRTVTHRCNSVEVIFQGLSREILTRIQRLPFNKLSCLVYSKSTLLICCDKIYFII